MLTESVISGYDGHDAPADDGHDATSNDGLLGIEVRASTASELPSRRAACWHMLA